MDGNMLKGAPFGKPPSIPNRAESQYNPLHTFELPKGTEKNYAHQFADMYFLRLAQLKKAVMQKAHEAWDDFELGGERATFVERVLDVRQGELCWIVGTVYMEMALKPNVLDDISKEHWIAAPPPRETYVSGTQDEMMLEDESGRLRVTGESLNSTYVTGCVLAALGTEQADGAFQVIATQYADLPRQPERWERDDAALAKAKKTTPKRGKSGKIAIVSGLEITGTDDDDLTLELLVEYLTGEATGPPTQTGASSVSRLIIAGDSLARASPILSREDFAEKKSKKHNYGYDASAYNASPAERLDELLSDILPTLPITLLPGANDPANVALPQQPLHPALFPKSRLYAEPPAKTNETLHGLDAVTNPWAGDIDGVRVLGTGGQTVADLLKYVDDVAALDVMEMMLRWRCIAPTAPDTLWCYPFQDADPLLLRDCPHVYFAGCQARFGTKRIEGPEGQSVLLVSVPRFRETGELVLVDLESGEVEVVEIGVVEPGE
ncbi:DNA polymerase alpha/epsilon subunit B-domain-containing protein [Boeremia exigua]|uniref:DNA polymerase alpha/epsilon subunit B-domain-containing protein n=1 Tax=Boeremia exigua TaxID=749465 RepID=UPI001E8E8479|nr:DNA polymerase alpha/epsilon subunit B-domain-containing protein [Boeremia exigua]KAH6629792.1 DNA polymerase alpha/epsilon subunit B-domain-containing protein [Boeremia exigua]